MSFRDTENRNRRDDDDVKIPRPPQQPPEPDPEPDDELRELVKPIKTLPFKPAFEAQ